MGGVNLSLYRLAMIARVELTFTASAVLANHIFHVCDRDGYRGGSLGAEEPPLS